MVRISEDFVSEPKKVLPKSNVKKNIKIPKITLPKLSFDSKKISKPSFKRKKKIISDDIPVDSNTSLDRDDINIKDNVSKSKDNEDFNVDDMDTNLESPVLDDSYGKKIVKPKRKNKVVPLEAARLVSVRKQLKFPANLIGDKELDLMLKMDTKIQTIRKIITRRFVISLLILLLGLMGGLIMRKYFAYIVIGSLVLSGLIWYLDVKNTNNYYAQYSITRQIAFTTFTRIAGALLPDLSDGSNLLSVFDKVSKYMDNQNDKVALEKLMIRMTTDKTNPEPFLEFAHKFSTTDRAELTMIYMHQMYLGNTDTSGLQSLINDTNEDYREQTKRIIEMKMRRFTMTTTKIAVSAIIVLFGYFGIYTFDLVSNIFKMMQHVKF